MVEEGAIVMFTRKRDVEEHIKYLCKIIELMSEDLSKITTIAHMPYSAEEVCEMYMTCADGPSILESILIREGSISEYDCIRNYKMEKVLANLIGMVKR